MEYTSTDISDIEADTDGQGTFTMVDELGRKRKFRPRKHTQTKKTAQTVTNKFDVLKRAENQISTQEDQAQHNKNDLPQTATTATKTRYPPIHLLKDMNQEFHTYTLPRDKPLKVVIKGLPPNMATGDIQQELVGLGFPVTDARQFTRKTKADNNTQTVTLLPTFQSSANYFPQLKSRSQQPVTEEARVPPPRKTPQLTALTEAMRQRSDRPNGRGGGTAVFIKNNTPHYLHNYNNLQNLEAAAVQVNTKSGSILFVAIYKPPTKTLLEHDLNSITDSDTIFLAGDLNSKHPNWNSRLTTRDGRILNEHADRNDYLVVGPGEPTFYPANPLHRPDIIDVVLTNMGVTSEDLTVLKELDSDHNPVLCEITINTNIEIKGLKRNISTSDWEGFKRSLNNTLPEFIDITTTEEADAILEIFTNTVQEAYKTNTTFETIKHDQKPQHPDLDFMIAQKREARRDWQRYRTPHHRNEWNIYVTDAALDSSKTWKITEQLKSIKNRSVPAIHGENGMAYTSSEKVEAIAVTPEKQFTPNDNPKDPDFFRDAKRSRIILAPGAAPDGEWKCIHLTPNPKKIKSYPNKQLLSPLPPPDSTGTTD
uniref:Endonuclease/exonuclease/phosphatase domain-containing protein n=1 Tax=Timema monikensis TaxID=170555 RepID=A0A7R9ED04_9NEOP|nr:unnamed protein product [Timema monikensis]